MALNTPVEKGQAIVGTNIEYAPYVEFGTRRQEAQPYLGPALEITRQRAVRTIDAEIAKSIVERFRTPRVRQVGNEGTFKFANFRPAIDDGLENGLIRLAVAGAAQARALTPVDTGDLRASITWKTSTEQGNV